MLSGGRWRPIREVLIRECNNSDSQCISCSNIDISWSYPVNQASKVLCSLLHNTYVISVDYCGSNKLLQKGVEAWEPRFSPPELVTSNLFRFHLWHLSCWKYGNGHSESIQAFREVLCVCCRHHNNSPSLISGSSCRILRRRRGDDSRESIWRRRRRDNRCKPQKNVRLRTDGRRERSIIKPHLRSSVTANQGAFDSSSPSIHSQFCLTPHCFAGAAPYMSRDS